MHRGQSHADAYFDASSYGFIISPSVHRLRLAMEQEYLLTEMADLLVSEDFSEKLTQIVEERWDKPLPTLRSEGRLVPSLLPLLSKERSDASLLPLLREEARRLLDVVVPVRRELTAELRHLENARRARLDATMEWERDLKEQVRGILEYLRQSESRQATVRGCRVDRLLSAERIFLHGRRGRSGSGHGRHDWRDPGPEHQSRRRSNSRRTGPPGLSKSGRRPSRIGSKGPGAVG